MFYNDDYEEEYDNSDQAYQEYKDLYIDFPERCDLKYFKRFGKKTLDSAIANLNRRANIITSTLAGDLNREDRNRLEGVLEELEEAQTRLRTYYDKI